MKLVLLGTGGFMLPEVGILFDGGTGLYRMLRYLQTPELDVYITHSHRDPRTKGGRHAFSSG